MKTIHKYFLYFFFSPEDVDGLFKWMVDNFNTQYNGNRAPFGFYIHAAWFQLSDAHYEAYKKFVQYINEKKDVYIVSILIITHKSIMINILRFFQTMARDPVG